MAARARSGLGCSLTARDSIKHLAYCGIGKTVAERFYQVAISWNLQVFLLCGTERDNDSYSRALLVYAAYPAYNRYRTLNIFPIAQRAVD